MANSDVREPDGVEEAQQVSAGEAQVLDADATARILESAEADTKSAEELDEREAHEAFGEDRLPMGPPLEDDGAVGAAQEDAAEEGIDPIDPLDTDEVEQAE